MEDKRTEMKVVSAHPIDPVTGRIDESDPPGQPYCEVERCGKFGEATHLDKDMVPRWYCSKHYHELWDKGDLT